MLKKIGLAVAAILAIAIGMILLVPRFVNWDKVGKLAAEKATEALGRDVSLSGLRVSLFSGIQVDGFRIGSRLGFSAAPLVQAERMVAKYRFLPLLRLKIIIDRIELVGPALYVERNRKGRLSLADLYSEDKKAKPAGPELAPAEKFPVELAINEIKIKRARLGFRDESAKPPSEISVEDLDLEVRNLTLSGEPSWLRATGLVKAAGIKMSAGLQGGFSLNLPASYVSLHGFKATVPGIEAETEGEITDFGRKPQVKIKQRVELDLSEAWKTIRRLSGERLSEAAAPAGKIEITADLSGPADNPSISGEAVLSRVTLRRGDDPALLENLEGNLRFSPGKLTAPALRFIALGNPFSLQLEVREPELAKLADFDPRRLAPQCEAVLTSPKLKLDGLIPDDREADEAAPNSETAPEKEPDFRKVVPAGLELDLEVRCDQVIFRELDMRDQRLKLRLKGGRLSAHQELTVCAGRFAASGEADLGTYPLQYLASARIEGAEAGKLGDAVFGSFLSKKAAAPVKGRLRGTGNLRVEVKGKGVTFAALKQDSSGAGRLWITEGAIIRPDLLAKIGKLLRQEWLSADFAFKTLGGDFTFEKAKAATPGFVMDPGPDGDIHATYAGSMDFEMKLDGYLVTKFHPRHADALMRGELGQLQFSRDAAGYAIGEWEVKGPAYRPVVVPSARSLKKKAAEKAKETAKEEVKKALPELEEKGKELLKKIFGK